MNKTTFKLQEAIESLADPRPRIPLTRREFLQGSAVLTGTLALGTSLAMVSPSRVWAAQMSVLDDKQARMLLRLTQVIFPHKDMPEAINALAVKELDKSAEDEAVAESFREGLAALDANASGDWLGASADEQLKAVELISDTGLFTTVRGQCITSLYDNELAYKHFGYEGESFSKGGYLQRGFNDLSWLPDPPYVASPAPR